MMVLLIICCNFSAGDRNHRSWKHRACEVQSKARGAHETGRRAFLLVHQLQIWTKGYKTLEEVEKWVCSIIVVSLKANKESLCLIYKDTWAMLVRCYVRNSLYSYVHRTPYLRTFATVYSKCKSRERVARQL